MNIKELQAEINATYQIYAQIENSVEQDIIKKLLNLIEQVASDNESLEAEIQHLHDEVSRLKGEQGKPDIKPNKKNRKQADISSEEERKKAEADANRNEGTENPKKRARKPKLSKMKIDQIKICPLDKAGLPDDLISKGYTDITVQDIIIKSNTIRYRRETYYSPSENKSYYGALPEGVKNQGEYGIGIRSLIPVLKTACRMTEKPIIEFFQNFGIVLSPTYLSQQWTGGYDWGHQEKSDLYYQGILNSDYAQIDDTSARVNGNNHYCQVVCNPLFTAYFTSQKKDRLSVLEILTDYAPSQYLYNHQAKSLLDTLKLANKTRSAVEAELPADTVMNEMQFAGHLAKIDTLGAGQLTKITEACAIAHYQQQTSFPVIDTLLADDAPQFKLLTKHMGLCWVHDARHYKKLRPVLKINQHILANFRGEYWAYYAELLEYQQAPAPDKKERLTKQFDEIFATVTDYGDLNDRIAKTLAKKVELLRILDLPELPLHNNASELAARVQARVRDISFQTRSDEGTKIKDTFMSINETAKKLGVSFYDYVYDRVSGEFRLPSLADLIIQKAHALPA
ncbi:MAG: transposase [Methyloprofundus sp.]|nr:transposase [Methyloprofundus sp.]